MYTGFWRGDLKERDHLKDLGSVRLIILKWMCQEIGCVRVDWVDLFQDRDKECASVEKVLNLRFP